MTKTQQQAFLIMLLLALFAGPVYYLLALLTLPVGLGLLMLAVDKGMLALYPFLFAGQEHSRDVVTYALGIGASFPLTVVQWVLIAWLFAKKAPEARPMVQFGRAVIVLLLVGLVLFIGLSAAGIQLASPYRMHM